MNQAITVVQRSGSFYGIGGLCHRPFPYLPFSFRFNWKVCRCSSVVPTRRLGSPYDHIAPPPASSHGPQALWYSFCLAASGSAQHHHPLDNAREVGGYPLHQSNQVHEVSIPVPDGADTNVDVNTDVNNAKIETGVVDVALNNVEETIPEARTSQQ